MNTGSNRIEIAGSGVGEVSDEVINARALEIAKSDGRSSSHDGDRAAAEAELKGIHPGAPEVDEVTGQLTEWDQSPDSSGHQAARIGYDDESNIASDLVEEGLEEADHDRRVAASDLDL